MFRITIQFMRLYRCIKYCAVAYNGYMVRQKYFEGIIFYFNDTTFEKLMNL